MMTTQDNSLFGQQDSDGPHGPVECLGITFANDGERRTHFTGLLREMLKNPAFRAIEGFPIGRDEDILLLSDPPFYTACPNPWLADFVAHYGKPYVPDSDTYEREPFAADVSEGKGNPIYNAHTYHTKVPHRAIMRYILHYTDPGDVVLDGFCGTGMTGVAAELCGDRATVEALGYTVRADGTILDEQGAVFSKLGARRAILNDLSPAATFIAYNYNALVNVRAFEQETKRVLAAVENECGWMYLTLHEPTEDQVREAVELLQNPGPDLKERAPHLPWATINYAVWSDIYTCPECGSEIVFWDVAVDTDAGAVNSEFACPQCGSSNNKNSVEHAWRTSLDPNSGAAHRVARTQLVSLRYSFGKTRLWKHPDAFDESLVRALDRRLPMHWYPTDEVPKGDKTGEPLRRGIQSVDQFFTPRSLSVLSAWVSLAKAADPPIRQRLLMAFTGVCQGESLMNRYLPRETSFPFYLLSGTLYVGALQRENNPIRDLRNKALLRLTKIGAASRATCIGTRSTGSRDAHFPPRQADYVFTDPPFGGNLMYSELNYLWEAWLGVRTDSLPEAIQNKTQRKDLLDYQRLMTQAFGAHYDCLKPGRWMTVEFHNSKNSVWRAIQEALEHCGFVVADVRTLDKKQGSFNQITAAGAVKQDLVISAYKPRAEVEQQFSLEAGTPEGAWAFLRGHLRQLPVAVERAATMEIVAERQAYLLYDRMVAFHVQRGVRVPLSASETYAGLDQRFPCRDGMYFLNEQVAEYDKKRLLSQEVQQLELFVTDEESAIQWLRQTLSDRPMSFQDIHPLFMREIAGWEKYEKALELAELLEENFIVYDGLGEVPSQIHAYLSSNFREMRGLDKTDPTLCTKAKDRWYVPDPRKAGDLEQLRERTLLREFDEYVAGRGKLKLFRLEAVRVGFKRAWQEHDYPTIITVAERLPAEVLQEDAKLLMWYDQALTRAGE